MRSPRRSRTWNSARPANPVIAATPAIPATEPAPGRRTEGRRGAARRCRVTSPPTSQAAAAAARSAGDSRAARRRSDLRVSRAGCGSPPTRPNTGPRSKPRCATCAHATARHGKHALGGKINIDVNSPEVQKLIWAAMPLLMRLRDDQKSEVRKLARVIGLEQVASQI